MKKKNQTLRHVRFSKVSVCTRELHLKENLLLADSRYICLQKNRNFSGQWELWASEMCFKLYLRRHLLICFSYQYNLHRFVSCACPFENIVYTGKIFMVLVLTLAENQQSLF